MSDPLASEPVFAAALRAIPDGKRGAVLVAATTEGAQFRFVARLGEHWTVTAQADWLRGQKPIARVEVSTSW